MSPLVAVKTETQNVPFPVKVSLRFIYRSDFIVKLYDESMKSWVFIGLRESIILLLNLPIQGHVYHTVLPFPSPIQIDVQHRTLSGHYHFISLSFFQHSNVSVIETMSPWGRTSSNSSKWMNSVYFETRSETLLCLYIRRTRVSGGPYRLGENHLVIHTLCS